MMPNRPSEENVYKFFANLVDDARISQSELADHYRQADFLILGPSGGGKSQLCQALAERGYFAANMPFVQGLFPKAMLKNFMAQQRPIIIGLDCSEKLIMERREHHRGHGTTYGSREEKREKVREELFALRKLYTDLGCKLLPTEFLHQGTRRIFSPDQLADQLATILPKPAGLDRRVRLYLNLLRYTPKTDNKNVAHVPG